MIFLIWLDDVRPIDKKYDSYVRYGTYADPKSVNAAIYWIEEAEKWGYKYFILDLDHDLGDYADDGGDGIKLLDWLVQTGRTTSNYQVRLHTMNVVGRENMQRMIDKYWEGKRI